MSRRLRLLQLYLSPYAIILWLNRAVYIGVILAALVVGDRFWGQFNLLYDVSGTLVIASVAGLVAHELGAFSGWLRRGRYEPVACYQEEPAVATPLMIFLISVAGSALLFALRGIPLLSDPMLRAQLGQNLGPLKRMMFVWLPLSALELRLYALRYRRFQSLSWFAIATTLVIFFLVTFKSKLVFFVIAVYLLPYGFELGGLRMPSPGRFVGRTVTALIVLAGLLVLYGKYALGSSEGGIAVIMLVRTTVLIAQAPNYIIGAMGPVPSATELLGNEMAEVLRFLRLPGGDLSRPIDTELTRNILGDQLIEAGGLNPTVIGYGWLVAGMFGVIAFSALYGYCTAAALRHFRDARSIREAVLWLFAAFTVFDAVQIFSPIGVLLDTGVSILLYYVMHRAISAILRLIRGDQVELLNGAGPTSVQL